MESLWRINTKISEEDLKKKSEIANIQHWDMIVVGAGMAGLLIAFYLQEQGKKVLVLEADKIASGQTERTTAKITSQHGLKYNKLIKTVGVEKARLYAQANEAAIREYEKLIKRNDIECGFERVSSYLYTLKEEESLKEEAKAASFLGIDAVFTTETELPFSVKGAVCFKKQAQFFPLEFVQYLVSKLDILEDTKITAIRGNRVITYNREWTADKIVIATHYPIFNKFGFYFLRQHQERSYVLALSGCPKFNGMYYGIDKESYSFRQAGDSLLFGGGSCRTGENQKGGIYEKLLQKATEYFPDCQEITHWSAQDCMPHDGIPFIGKYSMFSPDLYVATGFQKWGMTSSMIAAMIFRDAFCGLENPYAKLFSPQRVHFQAGIENFLTDVGMSIKGLSKGLFHIPSEKAVSLPNGHGGIVRINGKRYACYRDEQGNLHQISARCSHMGCELTWNADEKSWDCPCHGSRFDVDGNLLDNPSKKMVN